MWTYYPPCSRSSVSRTAQLEGDYPTHYLTEFKTVATKVRRGTKGAVVQARITDPKKTLLDHYAELQETTSSDLLRRLIDEYLIAMGRKYGAENRLPNPAQSSYNENTGAAIGSS